MEDVNIVLEVKKLNLAIGKYLFKKHEEKNIKMPPSPLQMEIIAFLVNCHDTVFLKDIQERICISKAAVTEVIDKMAKKGLIEKRICKDDLRKTEVILLNSGRELFNELNNNLNDANDEILKDISDKELEEFLKISHKIIRNIKKEDE